MLEAAAGKKFKTTLIRPWTLKAIMIVVTMAGTSNKQSSIVVWLSELVVGLNDPTIMLASPATWSTSTAPKHTLKKTMAAFTLKNKNKRTGSAKAAIRVIS